MLVWILILKQGWCLLWRFFFFLSLISLFLALLTTDFFDYRPISFPILNTGVVSDYFLTIINFWAIGLQKVCCNSSILLNLNSILNLVRWEAAPDTIIIISIRTGALFRHCRLVVKCNRDVIFFLRPLALRIRLLFNILTLHKDAFLHFRGLRICKWRDRIAAWGALISTSLENVSHVWKEAARGALLFSITACFGCSSLGGRRYILRLYQQFVLLESLRGFDTLRLGSIFHRSSLLDHVRGRRDAWLGMLAATCLLESAKLLIKEILLVETTILLLFSHLSKTKINYY